MVQTGERTQTNKQTNGRTDGQTDATKYIISLASRSIKIVKLKTVLIVSNTVSFVLNFCQGGFKIFRSVLQVECDMSDRDSELGSMSLQHKHPITDSTQRLRPSNAFGDMSQLSGQGMCKIINLKLLECFEMFSNFQWPLLLKTAVCRFQQQFIAFCNLINVKKNVCQHC